MHTHTHTQYIPLISISFMANGNVSKVFSCTLFVLFHSSNRHEVSYSKKLSWLCMCVCVRDEEEERESERVSVWLDYAMWCKQHLFLFCLHMMNTDNLMLNKSPQSNAIIIWSKSEILFTPWYISTSYITLMRHFHVAAILKIRISLKQKVGTMEIKYSTKKPTHKKKQQQQ